MAKKKDTAEGIVKNTISTISRMAGKATTRLAKALRRPQVAQIAPEPPQTHPAHFIGIPEPWHDCGCWGCQRQRVDQICAESLRVTQQVSLDGKFWVDTDSLLSAEGFPHRRIRQLED